MTEDCITIELLGSTLNADGSRTFEYRVTSNCDRGLSFIAFELPGGVRAVNPSTTAPLEAIENPGGTGGPFNPRFRNLKFELGGDFKGGDTATFSYTLPEGAEYDGEVRIRAKYATTVTDLELSAEECSLVDGDGGTPPSGDDSGSGGDNGSSDENGDDEKAKGKAKGWKSKGGRGQHLTLGAEETIVFGLEAAYPNPARAQATIRFALPEATEVRLAVYDVLGRRVATVADGRMPRGVHDVQVDLRAVPSGTYFYRLDTSFGSKSNSVVVVK